MNKQQLGRGVITPMITPMTNRGQIDLDSAAKIIDHLINGGSAPFILGTTGESASIAEFERPAFVQTMINVASARSMTYAGISSPSFYTSVQAAEKYFELGVDAVVAHPPSYYPLTADQLLNYYETLANTISGPLILYNIPSVTHVSIPLSIVDQLSHHEKIIALKDSERDLERLHDSLQLWTEREDFSHLLGWGAQMATGLLKGSHGLVPSTGNLVPKMYSDMYIAALKQDEEEVNHLQELTNQISAIYQKDRTLGQSLAALKVMMYGIDLCEPYVALPLKRLGIEEEQLILEQMRKYDFKSKVSID